MLRKPITGGIILLFLLSSLIPMVSSYESEENRTIYVDDGGGTDCISIKQFGNIEHLNDFHRKKIVSKNVNGTVGSDGLHFYGESNASIFIVTVESSSDITVVEGMYIISIRANGSHVITGSDFGGCYVTNGSVFFGIGGSRSSEVVKVGRLRYAHLKLGEIINFTHDKRKYYEYENNGLIYKATCMQRNLSIPSGKWHFIFTGLPFDLEQDDVKHNIKVWFNFSGDCNDLKVSTSEGGKIYALSYAQFDANIVVSKTWTFEFMLNGKASFQIENTFLYEFLDHPKLNGFWNVRWNTPDGIKKFNMIMINKKWCYNKKNVEGCVWGVGKSGYYTLNTSYLDYDPDGEIGLAYTPHFIGMDVKLP